MSKITTDNEKIREAMKSLIDAHDALVRSLDTEDFRVVYSGALRAESAVVEAAAALGYGLPAVEA